jgi:hypothetical protein
MFSRPVGILPPYLLGVQIYPLFADQTCPRSREITARHRAKRAPAII